MFCFIFSTHVFSGRKRLKLNPTDYLLWLWIYSSLPSPIYEEGLFLIEWNIIQHQTTQKRGLWSGIWWPRKVKLWFTKSQKFYTKIIWKRSNNRSRVINFVVVVVLHCWFARTDKQAGFPFHTLFLFLIRSLFPKVQFILNTLIPLPSNTCKVLLTANCWNSYMIGMAINH